MEVDRMNRVVDFYMGRTRDHAGRSIEEIWAYSFDELELHHDYIQWLFPNPTPSPVNPEAPVLDEETAGKFRRSDALRSKLSKSLAMMMRFYGFEGHLREGGAVVVERAPDFHARVENWLTKDNHNHLRLTRIMLCLTHCGLGLEARALLDQLIGLARSYPQSITMETLRYWRLAVAG
jgi:Opioid growth factor receptor (OGFr) conserved region